jgi:hypothetical protein
MVFVGYGWFHDSLHVCMYGNSGYAILDPTSTPNCLLTFNSQSTPQSLLIDRRTPKATLAYQNQILQCLPVAATWDLRLRRPPLGTGNATCFSGKTFSSIGLFNAGLSTQLQGRFARALILRTVVNITTDFLLALVPIPLIWSLKLNLRSRLSLVAILSLGVFASVAAIIKQHNAHQFRNPELYIHDAYSIWNFIELDIGIIAASLPTLKPLFSWLFETACSITRPTRGSGFGSRRVQRYQKHAGSTDIVLNEYRSGHSVTISTPSQERDCAGRRGGAAKGSQDSILTSEQREGFPKQIIVTRQVRIN